MGYLDSAGLSHFWGKVQAALAGKQNAITAGDGIEITDTAEGGQKISVETPVKGITKEEYDALSEEEKLADVLYAVTDDAPGGGSGGLEVYSTEETRIGTWIDGKPLYRRVYSLTTPSVAGTAWVLDDIGIENLGTISNLYGIMKATSTEGFDAYIYMNQYLSSKNICTLWLDGRRVGAHVELPGHLKCPFHMVLEYTKTTD